MTNLPPFVSAATFNAAMFVTGITIILIGVLT